MIFLNAIAAKLRGFSVWSEAASAVAAYVPAKTLEFN